MRSRWAERNRQKSQRHVEAGRKGGTATYLNHGSNHMKAIGANGAKAQQEKYDLVPYKQDDFAYVDKRTKQIVAFISGLPVEN